MHLLVELYSTFLAVCDVSDCVLDSEDQNFTGLYRIAWREMRAELSLRRSEDPLRPADEDGNQEGEEEEGNEDDDEFPDGGGPDDGDTIDGYNY